MSEIQALLGLASSETAIVAMAAISVAVTLAAIYLTLLDRDPSVRRIHKLAGLERAAEAPPRHAWRREERQASVSLMERVVEPLKLLKSAQTGKVVDKLARAGWRSKSALIVFLFCKLTFPFAAGGVAVLLLYGLNLYDLTPMWRLTIALTAVVAGLYLPEIYVKNATQKRQLEIRRALPDALDLMVICSEAGLSLDATISRVSGELRQAAPALADELRVTSAELGFIGDRRKALRNLAARTDLPAVRGMVGTLAQAERYGTPLAQSLRTLSAESRNERLMKAEEKAARLPALLTVPMIIFILPPLFVILLGSAALDIIDALSGIQY